jgi:hypothetical protein
MTDLIQRAKMMGIPAWNSLTSASPSFKKPRIEKAEAKLPFKKPYEPFRAPVSSIKQNKDVHILRPTPEFGHDLIQQFTNTDMF